MDHAIVGNPILSFSSPTIQVYIVTGPATLKSGSFYANNIDFFLLHISTTAVVAFLLRSK